jgi:ribosomal protein L11 methyltransferase
MKLGAGRVMGIDIDPQAVLASRDNALINHVQAEFVSAIDAPKIQADVVVANILTNPLRALAPLLAASTKPGGRIVLSGILSEQASDISAIYSEWIDLAPAVMEDGWACLSGTKR